MQLFGAIKKNYGWLILSILCLAIFTVSFESDFWIMGWDNFTASLNLPLNFSSTFFATWRHLRGFGVVSDSEVVDALKTLMLWVINLFVPIHLLDQVYFLFQFLVGWWGIFWLSRLTLVQIFKTKLSNFTYQIVPVLAVIIYGFNLFAWETIFLPIAMYVARYAFFPWIIYLFWRNIFIKKFSILNLFSFLIVIFLTSLSYVTGTVFLTLLIILGLMSITHLKYWRRLMILWLIFLGVNAFWLLPFFNYYQHKSALLPLASSFIEVNESLLNKPQQNYAWSNLLIYSSQTLDSRALPFTDLSTGNRWVISPLILDIQNWDIKIMLLIPVLFAGIGFVYLIYLAVYRKKFSHLWLVMLALGALFLLRKELWPMGFWYDWLTKQIPLFKIVFRFGGAKFYPLLLIVNTILASIGLAWWFNLINALKFRKAEILLQMLTTIWLVIIAVYPFRQSLTDGVFSSLVKVNFPPAYQELAAVINRSEGVGRTLHLPFDQFSYWKSYQWGYIGSSFFHFLINQPLLEKTFEPASQELDFFMQAVERLSFNTTALSPWQQQTKQNLLTNLLRRAGVKYIVYDESVSQNMTSQNIKAWGVFHQPDYQQTIDSLTKNKTLSLVAQQSIEIKNSLTAPKLSLFELNTTRPHTHFIAEAKNVDPQLENTFIDPLLLTDQDYIQSTQQPFILYPFWQPKHQIKIGDEGLVIEQQIETGQAELQLNQQPGRELYDIYFQMDEAEPALFIQPRPLPLARVFNIDQATKVVFPKTTEARPTHAQLDGQILSIPEKGGQKQHYLGSVLLNKQFEAFLFEPEQSQLIKNEAIELTKDPNCFGGKGLNYQYNFQNQNSALKLETQDGMTCLSTALLPSLKLDKKVTPRLYRVTLKGDSQTKIVDRTNQFILETPNVLQRQVGQIVRAKNSPSQIRACLIDINSFDCLNNDENYQFEQGLITIDSSQATVNQQSQLLLILPTSSGEISQIHLDQVNFETFVSLTKQQVVLPDISTQPLLVTIPAGEKLALHLPDIKSNGSWYGNAQGQPSFSGPLCQINDGYQSIWQTDAKFFSYVENCSSSINATVTVHPDSFYWWAAKYKVYMGKQPKLVVSQDEHEVFNQYLSRFSLYPNLPGFKQLQVADYPWWKDQNYQSFINQELARDNFIWADAGVSPLDTGDKRSKLSFAVSQHSEGQGLFGMTEASIRELPLAWRDLAVKTGENNLKFDVGEVVSEEQILPSLWRIKVRGPAETKNGQLLLAFGEAFDNQWQLYQADHAWQVFLGRRLLPADHVKVNGWSNGWIIKDEGLAEGEWVGYAFYTPERLAVLGWIITVVTILLAGLGIKLWLANGGSSDKSTS